MKPGFWDYVKAAFSARPAGMFVPPNWVGIGIFGLLGALNPGFWMIGAGLELGYLFSLSHNPRFRTLIDGRFLSRETRQRQARLLQQVRTLTPADKERFDALVARTFAVLSQQRTLVDDAISLATQEQGFNRLQVIYLRLLLTRQTILRVLRESQAAQHDRPGLQRRIDQLGEQLADESIDPQLRRSLAGQMEILQQRLAKQTEAREKLAYVEAELTRIQEQVELIREQAGLTTDPGTVCRKIDEISATLGGTSQWISEQQRLYGQVEDLLESPAVAIPPVSEGQTS